MKIGANTYKLILLDTNVIREIITNTNFSGNGFLKRFFSQGNTYAPCFSIYNVIELRPYGDIYERFLDFFSTVPCFMTFSTKQIIQEEYCQYINGQTSKLNNRLANAFTPIIDNSSYNLRKFVKAMESGLVTTIQEDVAELPNVAAAWEKQRNEAEKLLQKMSLPQSIIDEKFYRVQENETIIKDLKNWGVNPQKDIDISFLPALRIMEYSQFNRIYLTQKLIKPNDVMDIRISCIIPHMDAAITEGFQANVYKKAKQFIPQLADLEIYTLNDIRKH